MNGKRATRLRDAALAAAARGLFVFPCWPFSKIPAVKSWESAATRDPDQICAWWSQPRPWNIGVACGPSEVVVLDLDHGKGEPAPEEFAGATGGIDVLAMLAARAGQPPPWDTFTVATPSGGGLHLYFRAPAGVVLRNTAGEAGGGLGWKIDTRANGGLAVAAGSVRREGRYRISNDRPIAELPAWLVEALTPTPPAEPPLELATRVELSPGRAQAYLQAIINGEAETVSAAAAGGRNDALNRSAFNLGRLVGGGELDEDTARAALLAAAATHVGIDGFTKAEARRTVESGLRAGGLHPRRLSG